MTADPSSDSRIDTSRPHPARVYDWLLGGKDNYPVDEEVAAKLPPEARLNAMRNRAFMHRAAAWLAGNGIDQYLDIGTGIPTQPNLHQIVQGIVPSARIAYADNDPIVLRHAEALLVSSPEGSTDYIEADVRRPGTILDHARTFLDFTRPIALSMNALMHFITDDENPYGLTRTLLDALPSGSYFMFSHGTTDEHPHLVKSVTTAYRKGEIPLRMRTRAEIEPFFEGLELVAPGLVTATQWYKDSPAPAQELSGFYVGVARLP
ncbi:SAM-dependent methyltransferase [Streptomyces sp. NPDC002523]